MTFLNAKGVQEAAGRLRKWVRETPLVPSSAFDGFLKLENTQWTGAYKVRGAMNALLAQVAAGDKRPVVVASAGNHSSGAAWAARALGLEAIAVVPHSAPRIKIERTRMLGAQVILHGDTFDSAYDEATRIARVRGARLLHAFDDLDVIAGQGTVASELIDHRPDVVVVPVGGGGLAAGMGTLLKAHGITVVGAQVMGVNSMDRHLRGDHSPFHPKPTVADGIRVAKVGTQTSAICEQVLDHMVLVTEHEVRAAMASLALVDHIVAEGAGAVAAAAMKKLGACGRKVAVITGGNVDPEVLSQVLCENDLEVGLDPRVPEGFFTQRQQALLPVVTRLAG